MTNNYAIKTITAATDEPVDSTEVKKHIAIDSSETTFDTQINDYIKAATAYIEAATGRQICTATYDLIVDRFPAGRAAINIPKGQLQSITHIKYIDTDGVQTTLSSSKYKVSDSREPGIIQPAFDEVWPVSRREIDSVEIRFVCGYGDSTVTPEGIKQAALLLVGHYFEHREAVAFNTVASVVPLALVSLLASYKIGEGFLWYAPAH
jgi:uncharacterized phiE125 gp8 family phage protein